MNTYLTSSVSNEKCNVSYLAKRQIYSQPLEKRVHEPGKINLADTPTGVAFCTSEGSFSSGENIVLRSRVQQREVNTCVLPPWNFPPRGLHERAWGLYGIRLSVCTDVCVYLHIHDPLQLAVTVGAVAAQPVRAGAGVRRRAAGWQCSPGVHEQLLLSLALCSLSPVAFPPSPAAFLFPLFSFPLFFFFPLFF